MALVWRLRIQWWLGTLSEADRAFVSELSTSIHPSVIALFSHQKESALYPPHPLRQRAHKAQLLRCLRLYLV